MARAPSDPRRFRPATDLLVLFVVLLLVGILGSIGTITWGAVHRRQLLTTLEGVWIQTGSPVPEGTTGATDSRLVLNEETSHAPSGADASTGRLLVSGVLAGEHLSGAIVVHALPPWSNEVQLTTPRGVWRLAVSDHGASLTATDGGGRRLTFKHSAL
jgi:hypothetical protein